MSRPSRYLLDTNIVSEPIRPRPNPELMRRWQLHAEEVAVATTVWHELVYGLRRMPESKKKRVVERYLEDLRGSTLCILDYDVRAAEWHAVERARLEKIGRPLPFRDSQIGAVARVHGLILVTANVGDFEPLEGLEIENWLLPETR